MNSHLYTVSVAPSVSVVAEQLTTHPGGHAMMAEAAGLVVQIILAITALIGLFRRPR